MRPTTLLRRGWIVPALLMLWGSLARAAEVVVVYGLPDRVSARDVVRLSWTDLPAGADELEFELSLDGHRWTRISPQLEASERSWAWRVPDRSTEHARIRLRVGGEEHGEEHEEVAAVTRTFRIESAAAPSPEAPAAVPQADAPDDGGATLGVNLPPLSHRHHRFPVRLRSAQTLPVPPAALRLPLEPQAAAPVCVAGAGGDTRPVFVPLRN